MAWTLFCAVKPHVSSEDPTSILTGESDLAAWWDGVWRDLGVAWEDDATLQYLLSLTEDARLEGFVNKPVPGYV